jgi:hypothetical protein
MRVGMEKAEFENLTETDLNAALRYNPAVDTSGIQLGGFRSFDALDQIHYQKSGGTVFGKIVRNKNDFVSREELPEAPEIAPFLDKIQFRCIERSNSSINDTASRANFSMK